MKKYQKTKQTKRFQYRVNRNPSSHKAGANIVTITSKDYDTSGRGYSFEAMTDGAVTMSVKEARALQSFLNTEFPVIAPDDSQIG